MFFFFLFGCQALLKADFAELGKNVEAERVALRMQVLLLYEWTMDTHKAHRSGTHIAERVALRMQIHKAQEDAGTLVRNSVQILKSTQHIDFFTVNALGH